MITGAPWRPSPVEVAVSSDEVHVWRASLDQPTWYVQRLTQILSADERLRAEQFHFEQDWRRFTVARGLLRRILSCYLDVKPSDLQFCYGPAGKPCLPRSEMTDWGRVRFNLAHSRGLALYAITYDREVGIDLEHIRPMPDAEQIAARFFSSREVAAFRTTPPNKKLLAFFNCWTRKEAYLKANGDGLAQPLDQFEVSLAPGEPARLLRIHNDPQAASRWSIQELTPATGYAAAIAIENRSFSLTCYQQPAEIPTFREQIVV